jgi:myo-inositol-1(or 4)-monophosphatase
VRVDVDPSNVILSGMDANLHFASQLARQAGELLLKYFNRADNQTHLKFDRSIVTEADIAADHLIAQAIQGAYPGDNLLSEELQTVSPENVDEAVWIIDPLDGTTNFSLGLYYWGVSIARLKGNQLELAALYFPLLDELYITRRGQGAFLNNEAISVKLPDPKQPVSFFACCGHTHRRYDVRVPYKPRILGSAAFSFCSVARGIALIGFEATPKIWDIAAVWLLVKEAGGVIEGYEQDSPFPLLPGLDYSQRNFPTLAAANRELIQKARAWIQPK